MSSVRVSIRIPVDLRDKIAQGDRNVSEVVREALTKHLEKTHPEESCYDLGVRLGIVGSVKKAPRDLSTNRRHFRDFGK